MDLAFATKGLRQICERESKARSELGPDPAESLHKRLADIEALDALLPELPWLPVMLRTDKTVAIEFHPGYRLLAVANHGENPLNADGKIDWKLVERIKVIGIEKP